MHSRVAHLNPSLCSYSAFLHFQHTLHCNDNQQLRSNDTAPQTTFGMASDSTPSPFMDLPGELRNQIYRFALTESAGISVTAQGVQEPGLLLVNKEVSLTHRA